MVEAQEASAGETIPAETEKFTLKKLPPMWGDEMPAENEIAF